ncbi:hypothetical protein QYE76_016217 [Lolium multiflorum]|uniref:Transposase-associated domain-containing protein n=1 Tax=Lolium multiflorum TaxID=4521 RepID=A0AAD8U3W2_LOLMU|nr:hypothetical protein QYE76_016217 [Lolium multiflorum]
MLPEAMLPVPGAMLPEAMLTVPGAMLPEAMLTVPGAMLPEAMTPVPGAMLPEAMTPVPGAMLPVPGAPGEMLPVVLSDATEVGPGGTGSGVDDTGAGLDATGSGAGADATGAGPDATGAGADATGSGAGTHGTGAGATAGEGDMLLFCACTDVAMNQQWMYGNRLCDEFITGVNDFLAVTNANKQRGFVLCPCAACKNQKGYSSSRKVHVHLLRHGFMQSYNYWTKHGERGVRMEDNEEEDDDNYPDHFGDTFMEDAEGGETEGKGEGEGEEEARDEPADDLGRTIADAWRDFETEKERDNLDRMLEDHKKWLYPGCDNGLKKLGCTLYLLKWKAREGLSDSGFEKLLKIMKNMLPKNNEFPASTYEAKKVVCPQGLEVQKIHACFNDCILYRGEYENLNECPVCTALHYKIRGDDPGDDVEGEKPRKRVPAKVMWYAPIIPRLKRLFKNKEHAKLLR